MLEIILKFRDLLTTKEQRNAIVLFFMVLVTGIIEAMGVASVMPFLAVLSNPDSITTNTFLAFFYQRLNFSDVETFLFFLGIAVFIVVISSFSFTALTHYFITRYTHMRGYYLSSRLLRMYLSHPYGWFLNRHSADLSKTILSEVQHVVQQALLPTALFIANTVVSICLICLLIIVNPLVALFTAFLLGGAYILLYSFMRKYLSRIGTNRVVANKERFQIVQEALGAIKEVKAAGLEAGYINSFSKPAHRFARYMAANSILGEIPRFVLAALAFGGILIIILALLSTHGGKLDQILPTLGVFAFAGQRLLSALQQVYSNATKMRFGKPALDTLYDDFMGVDTSYDKFKTKNQAKKITPLGLNESLKLINVEFRYPGADKPALHDLNLTISAKSTVGFVGTTGAGKTTAVDVILGLLPPDKGEIHVDGSPLTNDKIHAWQRSLGYVPQQIFLADDTLAANIAFGVPKEEIDPEAVKRAASIAELHDFIEQELPQGYKTMAGERGVRLSGGQRQRIGIARALYHDPDVIIMDEATSALDTVTEQNVMRAVHNLSSKKTIILIAHRLSTVKDCDCIFMLDHGKVHAQGTYSQLFEKSSKFRKMADSNSKP